MSENYSKYSEYRILMVNDSENQLWAIFLSGVSAKKSNQENDQRLVRF
jgi:hypothetical protein